MNAPQPVPVRGRSPTTVGRDPVLGIRDNLGAFSLLVLQVAFIGALVGTERAVLPLLGQEEFGVSSHTAILSFILAFGLAKAPLNLLAGRLADRFGRRRVLLAGWLFGVPVPAAVALAPTWGWVVGANLFLGVQQGLCWSTAIFMKVDLAGQPRRGVAIGVNELAGYAGTAVAAYGAGLLAAVHGPRVAPFMLAETLAVGGLILAARSRDTSGHLTIDAPTAVRRRPLPFATLCQAGLVTKLADVAMWGLLPSTFATARLQWAPSPCWPRCTRPYGRHCSRGAGC